MPTYNLPAIKTSVATVKAEHPDLYGLLVELAEDLQAAYLDPESTIAPPANALVKAIKA